MLLFLQSNILESPICEYSDMLCEEFTISEAKTNELDRWKITGQFRNCSSQFFTSPGKVVPVLVNSDCI